MSLLEWFYTSVFFNWYERLWWWRHAHNTALVTVRNAIEEEERRDMEQEVQLDNGLISRTIAQTLTQNRVAGIYGLQRLMLWCVSGHLGGPFLSMFLRPFTERDAREATRSWSPTGIALRVAIVKCEYKQRGLGKFRAFLAGTLKWHDFVHPARNTPPATTTATSRN